ncbi:MAG: short-chain dehydrogenase [Chloroflexi bacterium]|jgi:3-oxoacyl-[acyl-carrier protein] reductase|nr:SDR family oxidoreductase [Dehalococcoidia bacterium]RUA18949.1 MAG: short-chain dehydrogenase [Chloroflexota bacterium]RUA30187.1 MAG: short-chain dehydrogenase [Chloroflexota bacterium]|tara:strand:- start:1509 stop:2306 length:798 start_codon:yes stop_codon:yes gene_type:complete
MELGLQNRVALVTGGSMGIGKATALALAREGADVAICARGKELLDSVAAEIAAETERTVLPIVADMNNEEDAQRFVRTAVDHFGRLDILVNCAGNSPGGTLQNLEESQWMESLNLKFMGYVRTTKAAVGHMKERRWGRIINVIGNDGVKPIYFELTPGAANAAGINFTLAIAEELAPHGITVNAVNPGPVDTERWWGLVRTLAREMDISEDEAQEKAVRSMPMGRLCTAEEVADVVVFLASERASFITAASIAVDGAQRKAIMDT